MLQSSNLSTWQFKPGGVPTCPGTMLDMEESEPVVLQSLGCPAGQLSAESREKWMPYDIESCPTVMMISRNGTSHIYGALALLVDNVPVVTDE